MNIMFEMINVHFLFSKSIYEFLKITSHASIKQVSKCLVLCFYLGSQNQKMKRQTMEECKSILPLQHLNHLAYKEKNKGTKLLCCGSSETNSPPKYQSTETVICSISFQIQDLFTIFDNFICIFSIIMCYIVNKLTSFLGDIRLILY